MKKCYICRQPLTEHHEKYFKLCKACGEINYKKKTELKDLSKYTAIVTGARIKIGYSTVLHLLRAGATVIATTRFPYTALEKYSKEKDFNLWKDKLFLCELDLKNFKEIEIFIKYVKETFGSIDIIINNAAQTVKKSKEYYMELERLEEICMLESGKKNLSSNIGILCSKENTLENQISQNIINIEKNYYHNSWTAKPEEISMYEFLEVQIINSTAPYFITSRLKECLLKSSNRNRFIINVSSVEGAFCEKKKSSKHIHTNMAKASLNMLTKSLGKDYAKENIFVYSVDPGWVSNQFPEKWNGVCDESFEAPLTYEDAAGRICDPIFAHMDDDYVHEFGVIYKDYKKWEW